MYRTLAALILLFPFAASAALFQPFVVSSSQKISDTEGYLSDPGSPGTNPGGLLADGDLLQAVAPLGLFDGDAVPDLAVGAQLRDLGGPDRGALFVLTLNADGTVATRVEIGHGSAGLALVDGDRFGSNAVALGDVDGDGVTDLAVSAERDDTGAADAGAVYVLFLNADGTLKDFAKIASGVGGGPILGSGDRFGTGLGSAGDLNGDGTQDLLVGAIRDDDAGQNAGAVYVLLLKGGVGEPDPGEVLGTPVKITTGVNGFTGPPGGQWFGRDADLIGDLDGDLRPEVAVGVSLGDAGAVDAGEVWILSLRSAAAGDAAGDIGKVFAETRISALEGGLPAGQLDAEDKFGTSVAPLGDLDGDGIADLMVNSLLDDDGGTDRGALWLLYLNSDGSVKAWDKLSDTRGCAGVDLDDGDAFGSIVGLLGDLSGDGTPELAVAAGADDDGGPDRGAVYVLSLEQPSPAGPSVVCASLELEMGVDRSSFARIALRQGVSPVGLLGYSAGSFTLPSGVIVPVTGTVQSPFPNPLFEGDVIYNTLGLFTMVVSPGSGAATVVPTGTPGALACSAPWPVPAAAATAARISGGGFRAASGLSGAVGIEVLAGAGTVFFPLYAQAVPPRLTSCFTRFGGIEGRAAGLPWADGTASVFYRTAMAGNPPPNATATRRGFDARTPFGQGHLSLVTPIAIQSNATEDFPSFARVNLTFVPEPSPLLGFLAGALLLVGLGRRRSRASRRR